MANRLQKALAGLFVVVGVYYCTHAGLTLLRLPTVTADWVQRSGDPDFPHDYGAFLMLTAAGAAFVALLGWQTIVKGVATMRGRPVSWLGPAIAALPLHWMWFLYRTMGSGILERPDQLAVQYSTALQFGVVCAGYWVLWATTRHWSAVSPVARRTRSRPSPA